MKKIMTLILAAALCLTALVGCGDNAGTDSNNYDSKTFKVAVVQQLDHSSLNEIRDAIEAELDAAPERASAQQLARHDDGQVVALAGEPLHREHKAVERLAVVDVRERGVGGNPSAEPDAVEVTVHVVHLVR